MENATKALLIAAAVFIVIVLIAVSIKILVPAANSTKGIDKTASAVEISTFNSQFEKYAGKQSAAETKSLISLVLTTWRAESDHNIKINACTGDNFSTQKTCNSIGTLSELMSILQIGNTYNVQMGSYDSDGYLTLINIY